MSGWIKLHRKFMEKGFYCKDSEKVHLWIHLLLKANHSGREEMLGGKPVFCAPGQFTTGRRQLSQETGISESKIERILKNFEEIEQQIEQQKTSTNRLISVSNWEEYQQAEQQTEQRVNNDRTTSEQRPNNDRTHYNNEIIKEEEELKNEREREINSFDIPLEILESLMEECKNENSVVETPRQVPEPPRCVVDEYVIDNYDLPLEECFKKLEDDQTWLEVVSMQHKTGSVDRTRQILKDFRLKLLGDGETVKSPRDAKKHFNSWLRLNPVKAASGEAYEDFYEAQKERVMKKLLQEM